MASDTKIERRGVYNTEYFSGGQVSLYIGDIWVDEITSLSYAVQQSRRPLYGYADQLFRDVAEGQVLVTGQFSLNFKEAGYLFLVLNRYREMHRSGTSVMNNSPFLATDFAVKQNIERLINNEFNEDTKRKLLLDIVNAAQQSGKGGLDGPVVGVNRQDHINTFSLATAEDARSSLGGFASSNRRRGSLEGAESMLEEFEDQIWGSTQAKLELDTRRADDPKLNPFDIYVGFGDFAGDNSVNHTIEKISEVRILGKAKQIVIDGQPIQETYNFLARNLV